jgi:hypothetical protein
VSAFWARFSAALSVPCTVFVAVHAAAGDGVVARVHAHAQRVATFIDPTPLAALGVLTSHVPEATRTQVRTRELKVDLSATRLAAVKRIDRS